MKFKVDENLPQELVSDLAEAGHDAETVVNRVWPESPTAISLR